MEANLCENIDMKQVAKAACLSEDSFRRLFISMAGIGLSEYIRRRRLSSAIYDLHNTNQTIIDIAVKYGYSSADAFTRAFEKQHGIKPSFARKADKLLNVYLPISFHIKMIGAEKMLCKIVRKPSITLYGISEAFTGSAAERWEQEHYMWAGAEHHKNIQEAVSISIPGKWYGVWDNGTYIIARESNINNLPKYTIKSAKYAVFQTGLGGFAGDELPELRNRIFNEWLPVSGYEVSNDYEVEVYHLFKKNEKHKRFYELWIPLIEN